MEILQLALLFEAAVIAGGLALGGATRNVIDFVWYETNTTLLSIMRSALFSRILR
jgi:hypothetical protein